MSSNNLESQVKAIFFKCEGNWSALGWKCQVKVKFHLPLEGETNFRNVLYAQCTNMIIIACDRRWKLLKECSLRCTKSSGVKDCWGHLTSSLMTWSI